MLHQASPEIGGHDLRQTAAAAGANARPAPQPASLSATSPILLNDAGAADLLGVGLSTFHTIRHEPWFPRPVVLGPRLVRWSRLELEQAVANMPRQQVASEPTQLLRGRIERAKRTGDLS